ncbi:MAG TPA: 16S rRNA (cytosine(1402)-N(4))-methyltransferase RsmH [Aggregatilineales bacterium]|nr:16S rRNA (cytosine(1402)-N(4))-methyltransferase RsmH [Aggregatilineales bacterium]
MSPIPHLPVLLQPVMDGLEVERHPDGLFIDGTVGAGGHASAILVRATNARLLGLDRDPRSLDIARETLARFGEHAILRHANYDQMGTLAPEIGFGAVDGILLDLGISSMHVDEAERGFSFRSDGPLDMRFDPTSGEETAADLVNTLDDDDLADLIFRYGEERDSRRIARAIVAARPLQTTRQLAEVLERAHRGPREKIHPATRTFQALRLVVNDELGALERVLPQAIPLLKPTGRLAVISFHSLEDRIVKHYFRREATDCLCPPRQPICTCGHVASVKLVNRNPIEADDAEIAVNPRSRSAKLRIVERLDTSAL